MGAAHTPSGWHVFLLGGSSATGKSTTARQLGRLLDIPWLQVDDFRLAFQRTRVTLPVQTEPLYYFLREDVWQEPAEALRDGLIAVRNLMSPAIEVVVENHVDQHDPAIIEGDGIMPSLLRRPALQSLYAAGLLRVAFLVEHDETIVTNNMARRGRGFVHLSAVEQHSQAHVAWLYGQWLTAEARQYGLPVVASRPLETQLERLLALLQQLQ